ncbi:MAG: glucose-1-phosphate thymidylyltransferase [Chitinophagaceae bacterium]|nr:MAG: glucose-1-phosphate thymidylyltransferase [Chitinophagaceae bacterium]
MKQLLLFDGTERKKLLPFTFARSVSSIRTGIYTIKEKWEKISNVEVFTKTEDYLQNKYPLNLKGETLYINGSILPDKSLWDSIQQLDLYEGIMINNEKLIFLTDNHDSNIESIKNWKNYTSPVLKIENLWDIFVLNGKAIEQDISLFHQNFSENNLPGVQLSGKHPLIVEEGGIVRAFSINTEAGPVFIGKNAEIMEGALIRGPFALLEKAVVKMGAKIYGATTVGPHSKVGGELNNVIIQAYSNKAHDGFLGNSVIGEWCNLGADTNCSNLKNNYGNVSIWSYEEKKMIDTKMQFCGLFMGDHSKCGINTMFNTGTVVGFSANIFGGGFPEKFLPSYSWGGIGGFSEYNPEKAFETMKIVMSRRNISFTESDKDIFLNIFEQTKINRS